MSLNCFRRILFWLICRKIINLFWVIKTLDCTGKLLLHNNKEKYWTKIISGFICIFKIQSIGWQEGVNMWTRHFCEWFHMNGFTYLTRYYIKYFPPKKKVDTKVIDIFQSHFISNSIKFDNAIFYQLKCATVQKLLQI